MATKLNLKASNLCKYYEKHTNKMNFRLDALLIYIILTKVTIVKFL